MLAQAVPQSRGYPPPECYVRKKSLLLMIRPYIVPSYVGSNEGRQRTMELREVVPTLGRMLNLSPSEGTLCKGWRVEDDRYG